MDSLGITHHFIRVNGVRLHVAVAGSGKPIYLLHGYPQSWYMWRKLVPLLTPHVRLVMPDLRGYGDSDKPLAGYDKRSMAQDIRELARHLGDRRLALVGHDRGARVAHRYALDHGDTLAGLLLLDIVPTRTFFERVNRHTAAGTWHWFFLPVADVAEPLIAANPELVLRHFLRQWSGSPLAIEEDAVQEYLRTFRLPGTIRATCADYRAGATVDLEHDATDAQHQIQAPVRVLWGGLGRLEQHFDVLAVWREKAREVEGRAVAESGHFLAEEAPEEVAQEILAFFQPLI
ncbi:MAG TPA: alpha/beta hydrolase [bacterium]|nr:alpha/beta hydrolase [bacterium]